MPPPRSYLPTSRGQRVYALPKPGLRNVWDTGVALGSYAYEQGRQHYNSQSAKAAMKSKRSRSSGKVWKNRSNSRSVTYSKRSKRRVSKPLKARVKALEKDSPPDSHYTVYNKTMYGLKQAQGAGIPTAIYQRKNLYFIPGVTPQDIEAGVTATEFPSGNVDLSVGNRKFKVSTFDHIVLKNGSIHTVHVKYAVVKCKDHTALDPITIASVEATDRGYSFANTVQGDVDSGTSPAVPVLLNLEKDENFYQILSMAYDNSFNLWEIEGKMKKCILNPGDMVDINMSNKYLYDTDVRDTETVEFNKDYSYGVVIEIIGELAHGSNNDTIGHSDWRVDASKRSKFTVTLNNGLGLNKVTSTYVSSGQTNPTSFVQAGADNVIE